MVTTGGQTVRLLTLPLFVALTKDTLIHLQTLTITHRVDRFKAEGSILSESLLTLKHNNQQVLEKEMEAGSSTILGWPDDHAQRGRGKVAL